MVDLEELLTRVKEHFPLLPKLEQEVSIILED